MLHALGDGLDVCVTVTLVDGFVLSRSAFHHSINYLAIRASTCYISRAPCPTPRILWTASTGRNCTG